MAKNRKTHGKGNFNLKIEKVNELEFKDFVNPWSFHALFISCDEVVYAWLREKRLIGIYSYMSLWQGGKT